VPSAEPTRTSCQWSVDEVSVWLQGEERGREGEGKAGRGKRREIGRRGRKRGAGEEQGGRRKEKLMEERDEGREGREE